MRRQKHPSFNLQHSKRWNGSLQAHLLLDLDARRAVDVPHDRDRQAPLPVGCRGHGDEGHRVRQRVDDRVVRAFFQHGREDHLLITLSTATERREEPLHVWACRSLSTLDKTWLNSNMWRLFFYLTTLLYILPLMRLLRAASCSTPAQIFTALY